MTLCDGTSEDCTGVATLTRDTSDGWLAPSHFCLSCAEAYAQWVDTYDPPDADGEAFRGGEAAAYQAELMAQARRLK